MGPRDIIADGPAGADAESAARPGRRFTGRRLAGCRFAGRRPAGHFAAVRWAKTTTLLV
ncbi:hypothetical protein SUDANB178_05757 [Streptomyces sp. enrichment culture]